ncbi:beta strand repeat-containing protein [Spirosoma lituiforme]
MKRNLYLATLLWCWALLVQAQSQIDGTVQVHPGGHMGVYNNLNFNTGYVITPRSLPGDNIYFTVSATHTGASDASHVNGYAEEAGHAAFTFPIGNGTSYRSAGIASASTAANYRAAYFSTNPSSATLPTGAPFATASRGTGVEAVSTVEYWDIDGSAAASITLTWNAASNVNTLTGGNPNQLVIVGWNGSQWVNLGRAGGFSGTLTGTGTITANNITPDTYAAYTFGSLACQLAATASITSGTICAGGTISLSASTTGAVGALSYAWSGPNGYSATGSAVTVSNATVSASGNYTVVVTDAGNGCSTTAVTATAITVNPQPVISSISTSNPTSCGTATGSLTLNGLIASTSYLVSYSFNGGAANTATLTSNASGQITLSGLASGSYTNITVSNSGCTSVAQTASLSDPSAPGTPTLTASPASSAICLGQSITLTASGSGSFTFSGPGLSSTTGSTVTATPTSAGNAVYTVTQTASGCTSAAATYTVLVNNQPIITSITPADPTSCATSTGSITINGLAPSVQYTIGFSKNGGAATTGVYTSNASGQVTVGGLSAGVYSAISASQGSCTSAPSSVSVTLVDPTPAAVTSSQLAGYSPTSCGSTTGRIEITGLPANSSGIVVGYTKNGVAGSANVSTDGSGKATISSLSAGNYANFTIQTAGCTSAPSSASVALTDPGLVALTSNSISSLNPTSCGASDGSITVSGLSANTNVILSYQRNGVNGSATVTTNGSGQAIIPSLSAGNYSVITYAIGACTSAPYNGTVAISDPGLAPLTASNVTGKAPTFCGGSNGRIDITGLAANQQISINYKKDGVAQPAVSAITNGSGQVTIANLSSGSYSDVTYAIGACTSAAYAGTINLQQPELIASQFTGINPAVCGGNTGRIEITGLGSNQSLSINYTLNGTPAVVAVTTDASGKAIVSGLLSGTYTAFSYSQGVCTSTTYGGPIYLSNPAPTVLNSSNVLGINPTQCGQTNGRIELTGLAASTSTTITYRRNNTAQSASVTSDANGKAVISGLLAGTYSDFTYTQGTCTSAPYVGPVTLSDPTPTVLTSANVASFNPTSCTATDGRIEITGLASNVSTTLSYARDGVATSAVLVTDNSGKATLSNLGTGNYTNFSYSQGSCTSAPYTATLAVAASGCSRLDLRVYLQGALYSNGGTIGANNLPLMRDNLRSGGYLPLNDPYRTTPYTSVFTQVNNAELQTIPASMTTTTGDKAIVDWVFVELRNKTNPALVSYSRSALVLRDGSVLDSDGQSGLKLTGISADDYYVSVRHRNHLGVMTAQAITVPSSTTVDFNTMTDVQVWNTSGYDAVERSTVTVGSTSVRALWAGNSVHNNKVKYIGSGTDLPGILSNVLNYSGSAAAYNFSNAYGYFIGDVNLDGRSLYIGSGNDGAFILSNVLNYPLNNTKVYNYDLLLQQLP